MYKNIADYGLIGDMHAVALVSKDGSIDYCSMPHIDSPTVFASILDDEKGGFFRIQPQGAFTSTQTYIQDTNLLMCQFENASAKAKLIDFMPVVRNELFDKKDHLIHRCLKVESGRMDFKLELFAKPHYALTKTLIEKQGNIFTLRTEKEVFTFVLGVKEYEWNDKVIDGIEINFTLQNNEEAHFDFIYGQKSVTEVAQCSSEITQDFWKAWLHRCASGTCRYWGKYNDRITRSLLTLKLLTFQPTGAIAAAATTSLPESLGGERNWDYRFTWIRDASFTLKAMFALGHIEEASDFARWLHATYKKHGSKNLQIMYSLNGKSDLKEIILDHLKGYKSSKPVRMGNGAFDQRQWDIYGEVMDTALRLSDYVGKIDETLWAFFQDVCNLAVKNWRKPDDGIWEVRNGPFHFVYSKIMCWVALDRGIKIARRYGFNAPLKEWENNKEQIKAEVLEKGYDQERNTFVQRYGSKDLDASLLLVALMEFLPLDDKRIQGTIMACKKGLMRNGFLLRYVSHDGLEGEEGGFILCNFWLIECLALSGKIDQARALLDKTVISSNHLGLFSEEYGLENGQLLGNFPQAFSHIGFINAIVAILNIEQKAQKDPTRNSLAERMRKLISPKISLNKSDFIDSGVEHDIASELKSTLNHLQGEFFDMLKGKVNYDALKGSQSFKNYLSLTDKLNGFNLSKLKTDDEKKAFWMNIYNVLIIHGVVHFDIEYSVKDVFNFFGRIGYTIGGSFFNPDDIEHGILRKNRRYPFLKTKPFSHFDKRRHYCVNTFDPRIHFALVCASNSCPPIEFYDAASINYQLDVAARSFINRNGLILKKAERVVRLSQIFKWYSSDFGTTGKEVIKYAANFANEEDRNYITKNIERLRVDYMPYDWNLNRKVE